MIEFTKAFKTADGSTHTSLDDAKKHEIVSILLDFKPPQTESAQKAAVETAEIIVEHATQIVDILTTTPTSKPRARRVNGGTKKRAKSVDPTGAAVTAGRSD